jgi:hypothetical protein
MILHRFQSLPQKTFFAPVYDYFIYETVIEGVNFDWFRNFCLEKEKEIMLRFPPGVDGQTGLGDNSLTSRFMHYNLFQFREAEFLRNTIKKHHDNILETLNLPLQKIFGQAWINVLRNGETIKAHRHGTDNYAYLSGNLTVSAEKTCTHYVNSFTGKVFSINNTPGKLTIFPGWIEHYTDTVEGPSERISIGLDTVNEIGFIEDIFDHKKDRWMELL